MSKFVRIRFAGVALVAIAAVFPVLAHRSDAGRPAARQNTEALSAVGMATVISPSAVWMRRGR